MITPSFGLTATERVLPKLALDFTTATLDSRVTFTRSGNTATYTNSSGVITTINANLPRFDYNPTTLVCQGLLIEEARTNIVLNSLIDGTILNTQIVTTSATAYTLSFYGTGSIVLTGTHSATVTGTGAYPSRKTYTFTPTAGALTLTVSGTVQYAQLETGSFATSFIPTSVASATRNADVATMTGTNFSSWYNASDGTFAVWSNLFEDAGRTLIQCSKTGSGYDELINVGRESSLDRWLSEIRSSAARQALIYTSQNTSIINTNNKTVLGYKASSFAICANGTTNGTASSGNVPSGMDRMAIGRDGVGSGNYLNGYIQKIMYWPQRLINNEIQAFSK